LKFILDNVLIGNVVPVFGAAIVGFFAMTGLRILGEQLIWDLMGRIGVDIRRDVFTDLQNLSPSFYKQSHTGDLLTRFSSDTNALRASIQQVICQKGIRRRLAKRADASLVVNRNVFVSLALSCASPPS
jgi:ABC-type multidrug transport system fused ATPase/permease subunit